MSSASPAPSIGRIVILRRQIALLQSGWFSGDTTALLK